MNRVIAFIKKETVLCVSGTLAFVSACFVRPDMEYLSYIDYSVLALLFCLMCVMAGYQSVGLFQRSGHALLANIRNTRQLAAVLIALCFFSSMLITNDVALITFVPFTIMVLLMAGQEHLMILIIVLQTIAANLGSMMTPIGNPQNLYLYSISGLALPEFMAVMLPYTAVSFLLLALSLFLIKKSEITLHELSQDTFPMSRKKLILYSVLFLLCISTVLHILPWQLMLLLVATAILLCDRTLFSKADYGLLLTFIFFFLFIGNMGRIPSVVLLISTVLTGHELIASVFASQVISNVPAALLLSGFTTSYEPILIGVNLGGLGTLIASLASLISYKYYVNMEHSSKGRYLGIFTLMNLIFLAALLLFAISILP